MLLFWRCRAATSGGFTYMGVQHHCDCLKVEGSLREWRSPQSDVLLRSGRSPAPCTPEETKPCGTGGEYVLTTAVRVERVQVNAINQCHHHPLWEARFLLTQAHQKPSSWTLTGAGRNRSLCEGHPSSWRIRGDPWSMCGAGADSDRLNRVQGGTSLLSHVFEETRPRGSGFFPQS